LPVKDARCAEYRDLANDLAIELKAPLDRHLEATVKVQALACALAFGSF
jgi:hypothetical protein